jgi:mRNA interferase MazF
MSRRRGDVVLVLYPFASGTRGSRRPALIVQNDTDHARLRNTIVAPITTNLRRVAEPTHLLLVQATVEGRQAGLLHVSVVSCTNLATVYEDRIERVVGHLPDEVMRCIDRCIKAALGLPQQEPSSSLWHGDGNKELHTEAVPQNPYRRPFTGTLGSRWSYYSQRSPVST